MGSKGVVTVSPRDRKPVPGFDWRVAIQQYDVTLKQLFERQARGLLRMLTGSSTIVESLNTELPSVRLPRMDLLIRLTDRLTNIEFQTTNEERIAEREGIYYLETRVKTRVEHLDQVVLYLGKRPMKMTNSN